NADRDLIGQRIGDLVDVADGGRHALGHALLQGSAFGLDQTTVFLALVAITDFSAAQNTDHAPNGVIVNRRLLARAPDETHHGKTVFRTGVQAVLLVVLRMRLGVLVVKPVVMRDEVADQRLNTGQNLRLVTCRPPDDRFHAV